MKPIAVCLMMVCAATGPPATFAQASWGSIVGNVSDQSGAVVRGATVAVRNSDTNVQVTITTDSAGYYQALKLTPGNYQVSVQNTGFQTLVFEAIQLAGGQQVRVDAQLQVGQITEKVEATGAALQINTENANTTLAEITPRETWTLPNSRGQTNPDVYNQLLTGYADLNNFGFSVGGTLSGQNAEVQDGMRIEGQADIIGGNRGFARPNQDSVESLVITTSDFSAKYPQQAAIESVIRSGTNKWHGDLWYQHGNKVFNATDRISGQKNPFVLHQFGGAVGGPIIKDKAFLFFSYQGFRFVQLESNLATVPTAKMRTGDLSEFLDPTFLAASRFSQPIVVSDPRTGLPFPNNKIPADRISPVAKAVLGAYPTTLNQSSPFINNFQQNDIAPSKEVNLDFRGDYYFNNKQHSYVRFSRFHFPAARSQTTLPGFGGNYFIVDVKTITAHHVSTISPRMLNDAMFGVFRNHTSMGPGLFGQTQTAWNQRLGISGIPANQDNGFPFITFQQTGITTPLSYGFGENDEYIYQLKDEVSYSRGRHTIQMGIDFRRDEQGSNLPGIGQGNGFTCQFGCIRFSGRWTGSDLGDFLLGLPFAASRMTLAPPDFRNRNEYGAYIQDDITLTKSFNLSLGLRYDYFPMVRSAHDLESLFDPASNRLVVPSERAITEIPPNVILPISIVTAQQAGFPSSLLNSQKNDWEPRVGAAYRLLSSTVIRGGFGIYHTPLVGVGRRLLSGPYQATSDFPDVQPPRGAAPVITFDNPYQGLSTGRPLINFFASDQHIDDPRHYSYNLSLDHQWGANAFTVEYEGKHSVVPYRPSLNALPPSLTPFRRSNLPFPRLGGVTGLKNGASYDFNALRLNARRRFTRDLYFDVTYVFSRTIDDAGGIVGETSGSPEDPFNLKRDRGVSNAIPPSRLTVNYIYDFPFGKGALAFGDSGVGKVLNQIVQGWETAGTYNWQTSPPLSVVGSYLNAAGQRYDAPNTNTFFGRPDYTGQPIAPTADQVAQGFIFNPNAFTAHVPAGRYGNVGRGVVWYGPRQLNVHQSFFRNFHIPWFVGQEGATFRFGFLMFNVLNHSNLTTPVTNMDSPLFGKRVRQYNGETRTMMLQGRIEF
ncbi:MAG TPA: TonB-dependent receptor [Candidatus Dormibacteraeota bacterium]|nr:TonB-dependent receptor [Candidatus Dormibacteraeota bacterium]